MVRYLQFQILETACINSNLQNMCLLWTVAINC